MFLGYSILQILQYLVRMLSTAKKFIKDRHQMSDVSKNVVHTIHNNLSNDEMCRQDILKCKQDISCLQNELCKMKQALTSMDDKILQVKRG